MRRHRMGIRKSEYDKTVQGEVSSRKEEARERAVSISSGARQLTSTKAIADAKGRAPCNWVL